MSAQETRRATKIKVTVTFPISQTGPFKENASAGETVGEVRAKAMHKFGVTEDPQHRYYLTHAGHEIPDSKTLAEVVGHARAVAFTLVKELVQG